MSTMPLKAVDMVEILTIFSTIPSICCRLTPRKRYARLGPPAIEIVMHSQQSEDKEGSHGRYTQG